MGVTRKIRKQVNSIADGTTFKYDQLIIKPKEFVAAAKAMERLIAKGIVRRISTGVFYKPKETVFGELKPTEDELLKTYLFEKGKRIAYVTGSSLYNRLGLTTQVPASIKIASRNKRISVSTGSFKARPVKSYVDVTDRNFYLLEILDVLKDFNKIPDLDKNSAIKIMSEKLNKLESAEIKLLIKSGLAYPPRARAFLGALLENIDASLDLKDLKKSLNPFSEYSFGIGEDQLPTVGNWNIKL